MSLFYSGSACNMTTFLSLTNTSGASTGTTTLSNQISGAGFITGFNINQPTTLGISSYTFGDTLNNVGLRMTSNSLVVSSNNATITTISPTYTNSNTYVVRWRNQASNNNLRLYLNNSNILNLNTASKLLFGSNAYHSFVGSNNGSTSPMTLNNFSVQNIVEIDNHLEVQGSISAGSNLFEGGVALSNKYASVNSVNSFWGGVAGGKVVTYSNIGIGTSNPVYSLEVVGGSSKLGITALTSGGATLGNTQINNFGVSGVAGFNSITLPTNLANYCVVQDSSGVSYLNCSPNQNIQFLCSNSEKMRMTSTGNFGIGTTNPQAKLHVENGGVYCCNYFLAQPTGAQYSNAPFSPCNTIPFYGLGISGFSTPSVCLTSYYDLNLTTIGNSGYIKCWAQNNPVMVIDPNGLTGIGLGWNAPETRLHVDNSNNGRIAQFGSNCYATRYGWLTCHSNINTTSILMGMDTNCNLGFYCASNGYALADASIDGSSNLMSIEKNGVVDIWKGRLYITGFTSQTRTYGWLNANGDTGKVTSPVTANYSLEATNRIVASEFNAVSDRRVKTEINDFDDALCYKLVSKISQKHFKKDDMYKVGFIAQEVDEVFPNAVTKINHRGYDDFHVIDPEQMLGVLWGAVKHLSAKLEALEKNVNS
jgi:hypothetical protein